MITVQCFLFNAIEPACTPRIAAYNTPCSFEKSFYEAIFLESLTCIFGAAWGKFTISMWKESLQQAVIWRDGFLIKSYAKGGGISWCMPDFLEKHFSNTLMELV